MPLYNIYTALQIISKKRVPPFAAKIVVSLIFWWCVSTVFSISAGLAYLLGIPIYLDRKYLFEIMTYFDVKLFFGIIFGSILFIVFSKFIQLISKKIKLSSNQDLINYCIDEVSSQLVGIGSIMIWIGIMTFFYKGDPSFPKINIQYWLSLSCGFILWLIAIILKWLTSHEEDDMACRR